MIDLEDNGRVLYQWSLNQRVIVDDYPPDTVVEFSARYDRKDSSVPVMAYEEGGHVYANIPNSVLQKAGYLRVFVRPSAGDPQHKPQQKDFKVVLREKPDDYDLLYKETEALTYKSLTASMDKRIQQQVGDLGDLDTTDKSSIVAAINEVKETALDDIPTATDEEVIQMLIDLDMLAAVKQSDGAILAVGNDILMW